MDLAQAYEEGLLTEVTRTAGSTPVFKTPAACGEWLTERLLDTLRSLGLEGDVATSTEVEADRQAAVELDGGILEMPLWGVVAVQQACHEGTPEHAGILVPFAVSGRVWLRGGKWELQAASLAAEDGDISFLR